MHTYVWAAIYAYMIVLRFRGTECPGLSAETLRFQVYTLPHSHAEVAGQAPAAAAMETCGVRTALGMLVENLSSIYGRLGVVED